MSLVDRLAEIRQMQGLAPLPNPGVIDGDPLPPPEMPQERETWQDEDPDAAEPEPRPQWTQEPLKASYQAPTPVVVSGDDKDAVDSFVEFLQGKELIVHDTAAIYRGRAAELNSKERASIVRVVLGAIRRILDEQYLEVAGPPRKRRSRMGAVSQAESAKGQDEVSRVAAPVPGLRPMVFATKDVADSYISKAGLSNCVSVEVNGAWEVFLKSAIPKKRRGRPRKVQHLDGHTSAS